MLTKEQLQERKERTEKYIQRYIENGGKTVDYNCPYCNANIITTRPDSKEPWNSMAVCLDCAEMYFIERTKTETKVYSLENTRENPSQVINY